MIYRSGDLVIRLAELADDALEGRGQPFRVRDEQIAARTFGDLAEKTRPIDEVGVGREPDP